MSMPKTLAHVALLKMLCHAFCFSVDVTFSIVYENSKPFYLCLLGRI